jgi:hypothetical protein
MNKKIILGVLWLFGIVFGCGSVFGCFTFPEHNISYDNEIGDKNFEFEYGSIIFNRSIENLTVLINGKNVDAVGNTNMYFTDMKDKTLEVLINNKIVYSADVSVIEIILEENKSDKFFENFKPTLILNLIFGLMLGIMGFKKVKSKGYYISVVVLWIIISFIIWIFYSSLGHASDCI